MLLCLAYAFKILLHTVNNYNYIARKKKKKA